MTSATAAERSSSRASRWPTYLPPVAVLAAAALLRVVAAMTFRPALLFSDSWAYVYMAYRAFPAAFAPDRPIGYPLLIRVLAGPSRELAIVAALQHLAGLVTGILVFALLRRLG